MGRSLDGWAVLITGASSGIGRATALACGRAGMRVALLARRVERLESLASEIRSGGGPALVVAGDVSSEGDCRKAVAAAECEFGAVDVLINNAGHGLLAWIEETPALEAVRIISVNLLGSFYPTRAVLPGMRARRRGHIVFISSGLGKKGLAGYGLYAATKFAQVGLADSLRSEVAPDGISVSVVFPVATRTEFRQSLSRPGPSPVPLPSGGPIQSADHVAACILRCLRRPKAEVFPFRPLRWLSVLNQLAPGLASRIVASARSRPSAG